MVIAQWQQQSTVNQPNKPYCNPLKTLPLHPLNTRILLVVINMRRGSEQNEYGICEGVVISIKWDNDGGKNVYCSWD